MVPPLQRKKNEKGGERGSERKGRRKKRREKGAFVKFQYFNEFCRLIVPGATSIRKNGCSKRKKKRDDDQMERRVFTNKFSVPKIYLFRMEG
jgi:hypothetical protein